MFPKLLLEIQEFLIQNPLFLSRRVSDGRINSTLNEREIIYKLTEQFGFKINELKARDWVDFSFEEEGEFFPIHSYVPKFPQFCPYFAF